MLIAQKRSSSAQCGDKTNKAGFLLFHSSIHEISALCSLSDQTDNQLRVRVHDDEGRQQQQRGRHDKPPNVVTRLLSIGISNR